MIAIAPIEDNHSNVRMKRGRPGSFPGVKRKLEPQDSDWVHQSDEKYIKGPGLGFSQFHYNLVRHPTVKQEPVSVMNKQSWAQQAFAGPLSPAMYGAMKRGSKPRASYVPYEKYGRRRTYAKRTARYPRKRAYASRPKFGGKKGSRFYYSKYKPRSYYVQGSRANIKRMGKTWRSATNTQRTNRKRLGYYGRGKYGMQTMRKAYNFVNTPAFKSGFRQGFAGVADAAAAGAAMATAAGQPEFAVPLGTAAGVLGVASNYIGRGSYKKNGLITGGADTMPRMQHINDETGSLMVSHRERLMDVFAPADSGFHQDVFTVSPGIEKTFPWLSQIAANYEEYELMQCVFEYDGHSLVGINDTLEVQGSLIMATQMNVKDKPFRDRHEMERFPHASKCAQHGSMAHGVECDPRKIQGDGHRYIRMGGLAKDEDARDFDHAKFTIGQYNTPTELAGKEIGQLFVYYTVKLMKPKISSGRGDAISTFRAFCENPDAGFAFGRLGNDAAQTVTNGMQVAARNSLPLTPTYGAPVANAQGVMVFTPSNDLTLTFDPYVSGTFRVTVTIGHGGTITDTSSITAVASGSAVLVKSQLPCTAGNVLFQSTGTEAIMIADVQVRPRDLASAQPAAIKIDGLDAEDLTKSCIEVTEINILEETSASDQPELKLIA